MTGKLKILLLIVLCCTMADGGLAAKKDRQAKNKAKQTAKNKKVKKPKKSPIPPLNGEVKATYDLEQALAYFSIDGFALALQDLAETVDKPYWSTAIQQKVAGFAKNLESVKAGVAKGDAASIKQAKEMLTFQRKMLLSNPLVKSEQLLVVKRAFKGSSSRTVTGPQLGKPRLNSHALNSISPAGWDNEIAVMSDLGNEDPTLTTLYKPADDAIVGEVDLHFDAKKIMFSSKGSHDDWHVFEVGTNGKGLKQLTPADQPHVHFFDSCYLPNDEIILSSTAAFQALPCEYGSKFMAQLYRLNPNNGKIRQLCFEQDSDWTPTLMNDGRVLYTRWEYTDEAHYFTRIVMTMNPDGTTQKAIYGSNSYFPNTLIYNQPLPGSSTKFVGIVGGHHGISHSGRLLIFDTNKGTHEVDGVVQEIPYRNRKVEPLIIDRLVDQSWPHFCNPHPLNEKYYLVTAKLSPHSLWGIYLVDVFDNMTLIKQIEGHALLEPIPLKPHRRPAVIPDKVQEGEKTSTVFISDVYSGPGLKNVPRGKVKALRLHSFYFAHQGVGGHNSVGVEAGWDVKRIHGTVPVEDDGSAFFTIPANTPMAILPVDENGAALQLMRTWFVGMPGENVSCVGCHEDMNTAPPARMLKAARRGPSPTKPWYGPVRPFSFKYEVQPVLDKFCVACHNGTKKDRPDFADAEEKQILRKRESFMPYSRSYLALQPYVRRPGPESDVHLFNPMEYHASTSELIQLIRKGHYNVRLDAEAWDRLNTWIDLNAPYRGYWNPPKYDGTVDQHARRLELAKLYANIDIDTEEEYKKLEAVKPAEKIKPVKPEKLPKPQPVALSGWPLNAGQKPGDSMELGLGGGKSIQLVKIPAGQFVMGDVEATPDEVPQAAVQIKKPFWMATLEITNEQYGLFDPQHDTRYIDTKGKDHRDPGKPANEPGQPVARVSWQEAMQYCEWLGKKTGKKVTLPTEAQWEWACRAGTDTPFWFGDLAADFSKKANLGDFSLGDLDGVKPKGDDKATDEFMLKYYIAKDYTFKDGAELAVAPGTYEANPWGLFDMHGNIAEWTRSSYKPYPYKADDGRNNLNVADRKVCRGGSWRDQPYRAASAYRIPYESYQKVVNVGFRVIVEE
ncbi:MAG: SUMF1/EgtB/PvdO family nonheme iron enzyme [Kiritimatiellales bacterium]|nr:SUMF1/EgtB/PvdO family nonheme iron enzyme [Kiritimatiellales bacterium]